MNERVYALPLPIFFTFRDAEDDKRIERLEFHLQAGDYFPFLATVFGFLQETVKDCAKDNTQYEFIQNVRKDLMHLHKNYRITHKDEL